MSEAPVSSVEPVKVRLDDDQMDTLREALKVAAAAMTGAALLADALGESFTARRCEEDARRFEDLWQQGAGVTRITVRF